MNSLKDIITEINNTDKELLLISRESLGSYHLYLFKNENSATFENYEIYGLKGIELQHDDEWKEGHYSPKFISRYNPIIYANNKHLKSELILGEQQILDYIISHDVWSKTRPSAESFIELGKKVLDFANYGN